MHVLFASIGCPSCKKGKLIMDVEAHRRPKDLLHYFIICQSCEMKFKIKVENAIFKELKEKP